jgi:sugar phosphate isomerase/epimerase
MLGDPHLLAVMLKEADIKAASINLSVCMHHDKPEKIVQSQARVEHAFRVARILDCPYVRIQGNSVRPHESRRNVISRIVANVKPLADKAIQHGVTLLFENNGSFAKAKDWWTVLNMTEHPMLGICWNPTNAHAVGELPAISIPMLHQRIFNCRINDLTQGTGNNFVALGQGVVPLREVIHRLMGIGYDRTLTVAYDKAWLADSTDVAEFLTHARETLTGWMDDSAKAITDAQAKIDKLAARNAPKPRKRAS